MGILSNQDLNLVTWEQRVLAGDPEYETTQELPDFNFADYARQLGLNGVRVEKPEDVAKAWRDALSADRPTVIDFVTDPNVPPLPPHISVEQAREFWKSMLKGDPQARGIFKLTARHMLATAKAKLPGGGSD